MCFQDITFSAFINDNWRNLFIRGKSFSMDKLVINLSYNVCGIALGKDKFF